MLSIIIPTYNEKQNLPELINRIKISAPNNEIIIVDDKSPDGTAQFAQNLGLLTLIRPTRTGLASAVIDGFKIANGDILCVMDADLSHPPEILSQMLSTIQNKEADFVIGSRLIKGGGQREENFIQRLISDIARWPAKFITDIKDVTSGFFMLKRSVIQGVELNPIGYKICLEILAKGKYEKAKEIPIIFANRSGSKSKMGIKIYLEFLGQIILLCKDQFISKYKNKRSKK